MVYLKSGESTYAKGNLTQVELVSEKPRTTVYKAIPQSMYQGRGGRPRIAPVKGADNENLKKILGVSIKGMTAEQRRAYNRLAKRKEYAKEQQIKYNSQTAQQFKQKLGKKIKDMSKAEKAEYYRLSKQEQRLRDK
jgi:hypothetical protein